MKALDARDLSIVITDKLISMGYVPDCTDTELMHEFDVQDAIEELLIENGYGVQ